MDEKLEKYYESQFEMFSSQGWKDFIEDTRKIADQMNKVENVPKDGLEKTKGQLDVLNWLINWEQTVDDTYKALKDE